MSNDRELSEGALTALEGLALSATPGPWEAGDIWVYTKPIYADDNRLANVLGMKFDDEARQEAERERGLANAAHIAAADPSTILALVAEIRRLRAALLSEPHSSSVVVSDSDVPMRPASALEVHGAAPSIATPTDSERDELLYVLTVDENPDVGDWLWAERRDRMRERLGPRADAILAADFRRTVQAEPSDAERDARAQLADRARMAANDLWNRGMDVITRWSDGSTFTTSDIKTLADAYEVDGFRRTRGGIRAALLAVSAQGEPDGAEVAYFTSLDGDYAEESSTLAQAEHVRREAAGGIPVDERTITKKVTYWVPVQAPEGEER